MFCFKKNKILFLEISIKQTLTIKFILLTREIL